MQVVPFTGPCFRRVGSNTFMNGLAMVASPGAWNGYTTINSALTFQQNRRAWELSGVGNWGNRKMISHKGVPYIGATYTTAEGAERTNGSIIWSTSVPATATGDFSGLVVVNLPNAAGFRRCLSQGAINGTAANTVFFLGNYSGSLNNTEQGTACVYIYNGSVVAGYANAANAIDGQFHVWTFDRTAGIFTLYRDGVNVTTSRSAANSNAIYNTNAANTASCISGIFNSGEAGFGMSATLAMFIAWDRGLTPAEHRAYGTYSDPFFTTYVRGLSFLKVPPAKIGRVVYLGQA